MGRAFLLAALLSALLPCAARANAPVGTAYTAVSTSSVALAWTLDAGARYTMVLAADAGFTAIVSSGTGALNQNTTSYQGLPATTYFFEVKVSTDPDANYTAAVSTFVLYAAPSGVQFTNVSSGTVSVYWDLIRTESYVMVLSTRSDFSTVYSSGTGALNQNTTTYAVVPGTYYFEVKTAGYPDAFYSAPISTTAANLAGSSTTATVDPNAVTTLTLVPASGAITLTAPAGAFGGANMVTLTVPPVLPPPSAGASGTIKPLGPAVDITLATPINQFLSGVSLQMSFAQPAGVDPSYIKLAWYDAARGMWWPELESDYDANAGRLNATIWHNTLHGAVVVRAASDLGQVKVFPNPVNFATAVRGTIKFMGLSAAPTITIYDLAGDRVVTIPPGASSGANYNDGLSGTAEWDGTNENGSPVARGTYIFVIRDQTGHKHSGKIGVVR